VTFDWTEKSTYDSLFDNAAKVGSSIRAVFIVAPQSLDAAPTVVEFVDLARARGVKRFVLLSAAPVDEGGPVMGKVHSYLKQLGTDGEVEWAVLRPTWFQGVLKLL
jgi:uncharacterized protein YbjT (DUF2867 family)